MRRLDVDLSSDTATRPTPGMRRAMARAEVGDEQRREDPSVLALEERVAELLGKEAAVFLPSGTMANIIALFVHCKPGDEVILHRDSHPLHSENGGPAVHSRVSLNAVDGPAGTFSATEVTAAVREVGYQRARSRLVAVENTNNRAGGAVWPCPLLEEVTAAARSHTLATHLDGARLLNAAVATGVSLTRLSAGFDSAWIDLSKGLGCPVGAVLGGSAAFVEEARWAKHLFGGAMRQAGVLAAAGLYALDNHVIRLADDHARARELAELFMAIDGVVLAQERVETNIVHLDIAATGLETAKVVQRLESSGVRFASISNWVLRVVTHLDVRPEHVPRAVAALQEALAAPTAT